MTDTSSPHCPDAGDAIRDAWYIMDGPSDRPKTVPECWDMIEHLLRLLGTVTGIGDASTLATWELPTAAAAPTDTGVCSVCGTTAEIASRQIHQHPHEHAYRRCYECSIATVPGGRPVTCPVCGSSAGEWPPSEVTR